MEDLKQKYLSMLYGNKKLYKNHELQMVDNLIDTHRIYNKENLSEQTKNPYLFRVWDVRLK